MLLLVEQQKSVKSMHELKKHYKMEDPDILLDLRHLNENKQDKCAVFWEQCQVYLNECTAVHERRHDAVTYIAKAISVRDLVEQVAKKCPEGTAIRSEQWVCLQFWPKNPRTKAASQYTKRLPVKMMVQKRQSRQNHMDSHYCAVKVGEPGTPVAAAEFSGM